MKPQLFSTIVLLCAASSHAPAALLPEHAPASLVRLFDGTGPTPWPCAPCAPPIDEPPLALGIESAQSGTQPPHQVLAAATKLFNGASPTPLTAIRRTTGFPPLPRPFARPWA